MRRGWRRAHGRIWTVLMLVLPLVLLGLMTLRQTAPLDRPAVLLEPAVPVGAGNAARDGDGQGGDR